LDHWSFVAKTAGSFELVLHRRQAHQTLTSWLYQELCSAIVDGRLRAGSRLPGSRDFAAQYGISRGTVVNVFERLQSEGYVFSRVGRGTVVSEGLRAAKAASPNPARRPAYIRRAVSAYVRPKPFVDWVPFAGRPPFQLADPAMEEFPARIWGGIAARHSRRFHAWISREDDGKGYRPLRKAIAQYLGLSRGVKCDANQVVIVSGVQQALDQLFRFLVKKGDPVRMEDPGYFGASIALKNAGAKIIPVPVDEQGLSVSAGRKLCPKAVGVFLTPGHQFPLGMTMSLERRMTVLQWASSAGAFVIEDDYDSEFRFTGQPVGALQGLDRNANVIFVGTFNKVLFTSLRLGYIVLPPPLVDIFHARRRQTDFHTLSLDQAVLCDFIVEGHFSRHLRRMRDLYASRLAALIEGGHTYLQGLLKISDIQAGLYTAAFLENGMSSREAEAAATASGIETRALDRFTIRRKDPKGLLLGFAAHDEKAIRQGLVRLAAALGG
jgi:GntR family transcriptional regulator/MocR family aminotransferase